MASLIEQKIYDVDSEVYILEAESEQPTDASNDSDDEPLRAPVSRRWRRVSSESSGNEQSTEQTSLSVDHLNLSVQ